MDNKHSVDEWVRYFIINSLKAPVPFTRLMAVRLSLLTAREQSKFFNNMMTTGIIVTIIGVLLMNMGMVAGGVITVLFANKTLTATKDKMSKKPTATRKVKPREQATAKVQTVELAKSITKAEETVQKVQDELFEKQEEKRLRIEKIAEDKAREQQRILDEQKTSKAITLSKQEAVKEAEALTELELLEELTIQETAVTVEQVAQLIEDEDDGDAILAKIAEELQNEEVTQESGGKEENLNINEEKEVKNKQEQEEVVEEQEEVVEKEETKPQEEPLTVNKESDENKNNKALIEVTVHDELDDLLGNISEK